VILLDLHLPDISGEEVLEQLKAEEATRDIPVVVVSADASRATMRRLQTAGVHGYLTKPINVAKLLQTLDDLLA
jgi:CheY-like chemotaxis protein